jgi:cytochrome P450
LDNASLLIIAGSETTATTLSGATYMLLTHPEILQKVKDEVRLSFSSEAEIDLLSVQKLSYMMAVLQEALRMYPPVPAAIPRKAQPGGDTICGQYVPENVSINTSLQRRSLVNSNRASDYIGDLAMANVS